MCVYVRGGSIYCVSGYMEPEAAWLNGYNSSTVYLTQELKTSCDTEPETWKGWWGGMTTINYFRMGNQYQYVMIYLLKTSMSLLSQFHHWKSGKTEQKVKEVMK